MIQPTEVQPLDNFRLRLHYDDGVEGIVDLSHLAGRGVFAIWDDPQVFARVTIGPHREIRWTEEVELCPDALYLEITGKPPEEIFPVLGASSHA